MMGSALKIAKGLMIGISEIEKSSAEGSVIHLGILILLPFSSRQTKHGSGLFVSKITVRGLPWNGWKG